MKKTSIILASAAVAIAVIGAIGYSAASFASEDSQPAGFGQRFENLSDEQKADMEAHRTEMEAKHEATQAALAAGDYEAWLASLPENCPMREKITAENFPRLVEAHQNLDAAKAIFEELGIEKGFGMMGGGKGQGKMMGMGGGPRGGNCQGE